MTLKPRGYFFSGVHVRFGKSSLSVANQAALTMERGLVCEDRVHLEKDLSTIGYYHLSAYWFPFEYLSEPRN